MSEIIRTEAALLRLSNDEPVAAGASVTRVNRPAVLLNAEPDANGMVTVQETYQIKPEDVGLYIRPAKVSVELSEHEAAFMSQIASTLQPVVSAVPAVFKAKTPEPPTVPDTPKVQAKADFLPAPPNA